MSGSRRIDLYQDDRGLSTCFAGANILEEWKTELVTTHKWETLEDFIYYFDEAALEKSLDQVLQATKFRDNRLVRARLKAAHAAGLEAIRTAAAEAKQPDAPDEVLPESTMQQLHKDFASRYGIVLDAFLEPSDALRSASIGNFASGPCQLSVWPKSALFFTNRHRSSRNQSAWARAFSWNLLPMNIEWSVLWWSTTSPYLGVRLGMGWLVQGG